MLASSTAESLPKLSIHLDQSFNTFSAGGCIQGNALVETNSTSPIKIKTLTVVLKGFGKAGAMKSFMLPFLATESYVFLSQSLDRVGDKNGKNNVTALQPGASSVFPFTFCIPPFLPSSFVWNLRKVLVKRGRRVLQIALSRGSINYLLRAILHLEFFYEPIVAEFPITICGNLNISKSDPRDFSVGEERVFESEYKKVTLSWFKSAIVGFKVRIFSPRPSFLFRESIRFCMEVSRGDVAVNAKLIMCIKFYYSKNKSDAEEEKVNILEVDEYLNDDELEWENELTIPSFSTDFPPTGLGTNGSNLVQVDYELVFQMIVADRLFKLAVPIIIGTFPLIPPRIYVDNELADSQPIAQNIIRRKSTNDIGKS